MYIDDGTAGDSGELRIDINGHEYVEEENFSYDHGNVVDSVSVDTGDGGHLVYTDTNHDGRADLVTQYDAHGGDQREAHFDAQSGRWVETGGAAGSPASTQAAVGTGAPETVVVDTAGGPHSVGPATVDTNNDGRPDTAVVHDANGDTVLYTDSHGTGHADVATEITPDGHVVIAHETGSGDWTATQHGRLENGQYHDDSDAAGPFTPPVDAQQPAAAADTPHDAHWVDARTSDESGWAGAFSGTGSARGVVRIDANTGQWISQN